MFEGDEDTMISFKNNHKKIGSIVMSLLLISLIYLVLLPPATAVYVTPGTPNKSSLTSGSTITFSNVNVTIRALERIPVQNLTFSIYNNANDALVAYVIFTFGGVELSDSPSGKFTVTNTTAIQDGWYEYGYGYGYDELDGPGYNFSQGYGYGYLDASSNAITMLYDIIYTTHTTGTFYGKLTVNCSTQTYESAESTRFTVSSGGTGGGGGPAGGTATTPETEQEYEATQDMLDEISSEIEITLTQPFYANDTDGDGQVDSFTDPNNILTVVSTTSMNGTTVFLLTDDDTEIPLLFWDPIDGSISFIEEKNAIVTDEAIDATTDTVKATITVDKPESQWIYITLEDTYPSDTLLKIETEDGREISSDKIWREDGMIYILDDPDETYHLYYGFEPTTVDITISPEVIYATQAEDFEVTITLAPSGRVTELTGTLTQAIYNGSTLLWNSEKDIQFTTETELDETISTASIVSGEYTYKVEFNYGLDQTADASVSCIITEPSSEPTGGIPWIIAIIGIIIAGILATLFILVKKDIISIEYQKK
jgi:hypothetical protein